MTERLTPEREAAIRRLLTTVGPPVHEDALGDLLAELDAVRAERDEARARAEAYTARVRRAALEEAAGVCDAFAAEGGEAPHRHVADEAADEIAGRLRTMAREGKP